MGDRRMKPWEETWTADRDTDGAVILRNTPGRADNSIIAAFEFNPDDAVDEARARLVAQAPAAMRLLLDLQSDDLLMPHLKTKVQALLRAAGVIE
jgi:hypothetical protein